MSFERNTWVGVAVKAGGGLIAAGVESTTGLIFNLQNPSWCRLFSIESIRLQIGIGGGIGANVVVIFNCPSIFTIDGKDISDWGFNFSLGPNWKAIATNLTKMGFFGKAIKAKNTLKAAQKIEDLKAMKIASTLSPSDMETIKNGANYLWNAHDAATRGNNSMIMVLDVPGAGIGAEISLCPIIRGKFSVLPT